MLYELTVLLKPDLNEQDKEKEFTFIKKTLSSYKAKIKTIQESRPVRLAYDIQKFKAAILKSFYFETDQKDRKNINKLISTLNLQENILRVSLLRSETLKPKTKTSQKNGKAKKKKPKTAKPAKIKEPTKAKPKKESKPKTKEKDKKTSLEEIDKKLDEILKEE